MTFTAVADTHTVIWYIFSDSRLSSSARETIDRAAADGFFVGVSTISLSEIVYLSEKKRISPDTFKRLLEVCRDPEKVLAEIPLDSGIIEVMPKIPRSEIPDLPDRIVAATALSLSVPVITRDHKIRISQLESIW